MQTASFLVSFLAAVSVIGVKITLEERARNLLPSGTPGGNYFVLAYRVEQSAHGNELEAASTFYHIREGAKLQGSVKVTHDGELHLINKFPFEVDVVAQKGDGNRFSVEHRLLVSNHWQEVAPAGTVDFSDPSEYLGLSYHLSAEDMDVLKRI